MKRLIALMISVIMIFSVLPFSAIGAEEKAYCITLDANGGVIEGKGVYPINCGDRYSDIFGNNLPYAAREGYTLVGWLCEKYNYMLSVSSGDYYVVNENTVFKAVWVDSEGNSPEENEKKFVMSFDPNGGIMEGLDVYRINTGDRYIDVIDKEPSVTREGCEFLGWLCEKYNYTLCVNETDVFSVAENVVFKAQWDRTDRAYTVTLDPNGGTLSSKSEYKIDRGEFYVDRIGETMPNPVRDGYVFGGWYNEKYDFMLSIMPTAYHKYDESLTFIAIWEKIGDAPVVEVKKDYTITLDGNGGELIGQSVYPANTGDTYTDIFGGEPSAYRPGYTLSGWHCEKYNYTMELNGQAYLAVSEDVTFKAVWTKNNYLGIGVDGYHVILSRADEISHIRYAEGVYSDSSSIKNAEDCVELNERVISAYVTEGLYVREMPELSTYSFWIKYNDGSTNIFLARLTSPEQYVSVDGVTLNIKGLYGIRDIFVAKGSYNSYSEVKNNGGVQISQNKIGDKHSYAYNVSSPGEYTLCIRYTDTTEHKILKAIVYEKEPIYTEKGLQLEISNLKNIKVIRTAYGEFSTAGEIKRADGSRGFSAKTIGKESTYTVQYKTEGRVSVAVVYQNGYTHIRYYDVKKLVPDIETIGRNIYLSELDNLSVIRYARGEYKTVNEIKQAPDNRYIKNVEGNECVISGLTSGRYTVYIQYNDGSNYFYYTEATDMTVDATGVKVSSAFTDSMVLQRDEKLSVWGFADEESNGRTVAVTLGGKTAYATVSEGKWKAVFDETFPYDNEPKDLKIYSAEDVKIIKDVLIGDVYFIIGQSNVHYTILEEINDLKHHGRSNELDLDFDDSRNMRFFRISNSDYWSMTGEMKQGTAYEYEDVYNGRVWQKPSDIEALINRNASTYEVFSALGYLFAYNMTNETDVPVGMIQIEASGHPLTSFAPNHLAEKWGDEWYKESTDTYHTPFNSPSRYVYNQQIHPLRHFSIAGLIWYQGESDEYNTVERKGIGASTFKNEFAELMTYFRSVFGNSDFPVYLNEFPAHTGGFDFGCARVEVGVVPQILENSYVVPASDTFSNVNWHNSIHPYVKRIQARRLCDMVLANRFGVGEIERVSGPLLEGVDYTGNTAVLDFKYTAEGLTTFAADDFGNDIVGIELLCNGRWQEADAEITENDKITVTADSEIKGVRYYRQSSGYYPVHANLCNSEGIPCVAFVDYK